MASASTLSSGGTFVYIVLGVIVAAIIGMVIIRNRPLPTPLGAAALAQCLTEKKVKFYGAFWCEHCKRQKELFGGAASQLPYIECYVGNKQSQECNAVGVESYPTWVNAAGKKITGEQSFEQLAEFSGCEFKK